MDEEDAVAIVGVGGKFPGADNLDEFWRLLVNGENHVIEIPPDRWKSEAFYSEEKETPGKTYVKKAGFIKNFALWDNKCFGINDIEAERIDPQQRYVLECVHMALEDGGITRKSINGSNTGVFIGVMNDDYKSSTNDDLKAVTNYTLTGVSPSIIAARVSYVFNLLGMSMCIDTACSSSLVAIDTGIQYLKNDRCSMVICGGVNSIITPDIFVPLSQARMLSPTGQCQAFSDKADGYARGEGCGIVILKKLRKAVEDGNKIWATIATCCNQDGGTVTPMTAPSSVQQETLLHTIYSANNVSPHSIQVIEAHGTGTPKGDPVEANSLGNVIGQNRHMEMDLPETPVYIGSVKTNIGHLEAAAGVAGLIKVLLMMKNKTIVSSLHFERPHRDLNFDRFNFCVPTSNLDWACDDDIYRMACINSFGFGGTNAHAIIQEHTNLLPNVKGTKQKKDPCLVFLSAFTNEGLALVIDKFIEQLGTTTEHLESISYTSLCCRDHFQYRAGFCTKSIDDFINKCVEKKQYVLNMLKFKKKSPATLKIIAVFCGVGTEWLGMCAEIMKYEEIGFKTMIKIDEFLKTLTTDFSLYDILINGRELLKPMEIHIAIFACQVILWTIWKHWGLTIDAVIGQSVGEVAAAYASGALSLEMAVKLIYYRSKYLAKVTSGTMFVVGESSVDVIVKVLKDYDGKACIAIHNSPMSCTISCDTDVADQLKTSIIKTCSPHKVLIHNLSVAGAYHSHLTKDAGRKLEKALGNGQIFSGNPTTVPMMSTVTCNWINHFDLTNPSYWRDNVCRPVQFYRAVTGVSTESGYNIFLEIGPKPVLKSHLSFIFPTKNAICLPSMQKKNEIETVMNTASALFEAGANLDWRKMHKGPKKISNLPKYIFMKTNKLFDSETTLLKKQGIERVYKSHLFVRSSTDTASSFQLVIDPEGTPFVYNHKVSNTIVVPGTLYAEAAAEVAHLITEHSLENLVISVKYVKAISLMPCQKVIGNIFISDHTNERQVSGTITRDMETIARFTCQQIEDTSKKECIDINLLRHYCTEKMTQTEIYSTLSLFGFSYGQELQMITEVSKKDDQCFATFKVTNQIWKDAKVMTHLHPSILDALLQTTIVFKSSDSNTRPFLPTGIEQLKIRRKPEKLMYGFSQRTFVSERASMFNLLLLSADGEIIAEVKDFKTEIVNYVVDNTLEYRLSWKETEYFALKHVKDLPTNTGDDTIIVCLNERVKNVLKSSLQSKTNVYLLNKNAFEEEVGSQLTGNPHVTKLFYIPGLRYSGDMTNSTNSVHDNVLLTCRILYKILQSVLKSDGRIKITVITESTQHLEIVNKEETNILGSELWGLVRCVLREHDFNIHLVDVNPSIEESEPFIAHLMADENDHLGKMAEIVYCNGKLFTSNFEACGDKYSLYRSATLDKGCQFSLKSRNPNDFSDLLCVIINSDIDEHNPSNSSECVDLTVDRICLPWQPHMSTIAYNDVGKPVIWPELDENGFNITTFEVLGHLSNNSSNKCNQEYVACYPLQAENIVRVPSFCTCAIDRLPGYQPGLVFVSVLFWAMKEKINTNKCINVVCQCENRFQSLLFSCLLKTAIPANHVKITTMPDIHPEAQIVVPLGLMENRTIDAILKNTSIESVVSLDMFIDSRYKPLLAHHQIFLHIIETYNVFLKDNLTQIVPNVFNWLSKNLPDVYMYRGNKADGEQSILSLPYRTVRMSCENISNSMKVIAPTGAPFRNDSSYIVIGGLSGLGWELLKLLAETGAGEVISLSRRQIDEEKQNKLNELTRGTGCHFRTYSVDIASITDLKSVFDQIRLNSKPVKGIFQGAGILRDTLCHNMTDDKLEDVLKPKVLGTWNLHILSTMYPLDYFMVHSSMTSIFGNQGQSNYGAANSFIDCLIHYRRSKGLCGQSINWGPLRVGMVKGHGIEDILKIGGFDLLSVSEVKEILLKCLDSSQVQVVVGKFDWKIISKNLSYAGIRNDLTKEKFRSFTLRYSNPNDKDMSPSFHDKVHREDNNDKCSEIVLKTISEICGVDIDSLHDRTIIQSLGFDSLQAMTFAQKVSEATGKMPLTLVYLLSPDLSIGDITKKVYEAVPNKDQKRDSTVQYSSRWIMNSMTPMEKMIYDQYENDPSDPSLIIFVDLEVSQNIAKPALWKELLQNVVYKHAILRTLFLPNQPDVRYDVRKKVLNYEEATVPFYTVSKLEMESCDLSRFYQSNRDHYFFNPGKDLPVRLLFCNEGNVCLVRIVFNHLCVDLTSTGILMTNFMSKADQIKSKTVSSKYDHDIACLVDKKLQEEYAKLDSFWKSYTPKLLQPMTLRPSKNIILDPNCFDFYRVRIDEEIVKKIKLFLQKNFVTLFDFVASHQQILFHAILGIQNITLFGDMDMRMHFPELMNTVGKLTNSVILYTDIQDDNINVTSFVKENKKVILKVIEHSLLPFEDALKYVKGIDLEDVFLHSIVMEDTSIWKAKDGNSDFKIKRAITGDYNHETGLLVWYNLSNDQIDLELVYNTGAVEKSYAAFLINSLTMMMAATVTDHNLSLKDLCQMVSSDTINPDTPMEEPAKKAAEKGEDNRRKRKKFTFNK